MQIKIGADPELFIQKDGKFVSAHGLIPGSKIEPYPVERGAVQVDGMALEFNIDPAENFQAFGHNINAVLCTLRDMVPEEYDFVLKPTAEFDPDYMKSLPPEAVELGCDPDYNAWTGQVNERPAQHPTMRTAAGHVHIGWTEDQDITDQSHFDLCIELAKEMDAWIGVHSVSVDNDQKRREMYGQAGAFRPKPYGMEYRVLSNYWVANQKETEIVWHLTNVATSLVSENKGISDRLIKDGWDVQKIINNGDQMAARVVKGEYHAY